MTSTRPPEPGSTQAKIQRAFSETVDPTAYVPRPATESVLMRLRGWADSSDSAGAGSTLAALLAQPGLGKTFLLRSFERYVVDTSRASGRSRRALYLPYAGLSMTDLSIWVHGLLGRPADPSEFSETTDSDSATVNALCRLADNPRDPLILVIDDADSMPTETARALVKGLPTEGSPLRILLALNDDAKASRLIAALDPLRPSLTHLQGEMTEAETAAYIEARSRWAKLEESEIARFDSAAMSKIHSLSGGVPRRIHLLAAAFYEAEGDGRPSALDEKQKRENWMGQPIEDDL